MTNSKTMNTADSEGSATPGSRGHAVLVPGYWLGAWAWDDVTPTLQAAGFDTHAVTLPGLDAGTAASPNGTEVTLDDHILAVAELIEGLEGPVTLIGHSGGATVVQCLVDRQPERFDRVVYIDAGPLRAGISLYPDTVGDMALPTWEELAANHVSTDGMDDAALERFRTRAVPQPGGVARSAITLTDERRLAVPATVICTSLPSPMLRKMIEEGQIPSELLDVDEVRYVDLPTGHWPMFSRPDDLADALVDELTPAAAKG